MIDLLLDHGPALVLGGTLVLALGVLITLCSRAPVHRQRVGEFTLAATFVFAVLALVPLPRWAGAESSARAARRLPPVAEAVRGPNLEVRSAGPPEIFQPTRVLPSPPPPTQPREDPRPIKHLPTPEPAAKRPALQEQNPATVFDASRVTAGGFLLGVAACLAWLALGAWTLHRIVRRARPASPELRSRFDNLAGGVARARLLVASGRCRPFCTGVRRPVVVVPESLTQPEASDELRTVLLHELAHVQRGDLAGQVLFAAALPLLWFHPLYWCLRRSVRLASETLADDVAAARSGRHEYARLLIAFAERDAAFAAPGGALSIFRSRTEFSRRIEMLVSRNERLAWRCSWMRRTVHLGLLVVVVTLAAGVFGVRPVAAQTPESEVKKQQEARAKLAELRRQRARLLKELRELERRAGLERPGTNKSAPEPDVAQPGVGNDFGPRGYPKRRPSAAPGATEAPTQRDPVAGSAPRRGEAAAPVPRPNRNPFTPRPSARDPHRPTAPSTPESPFARGPRRAPAPSRLSSVAPRGTSADACFLLVSRIIDLRAEVEIGQANMARISGLVKANAASKSELTGLAIRLRAAERKLDVARGLAESELVATMEEIKALERQADLMKAGRGTISDYGSRMARLRGRIDALKRAL
ncbi:MAG: hypothetical protein CMJ18_15510 [Phycisphaeraceae bacterium]|nr:hypothetical protein [Phycisphaeraceae bacterium]